eukprot:gene7145-251_t
MAAGGEMGTTDKLNIATTTATTLAKSSLCYLSPISSDYQGLLAIIKGCWQLDGNHLGVPITNRTSGSAALEDFDAFVRAGITTWDTADIYGGSETTIGQYFRLNPWQREKVQLMTKVTVTEDGEDFNRPGFVEAALWLSDLKEQGLIGNIGVTNFDTPHLIRLLDAGVKVSSNQVQYSVMDRRPELFLTDLCTRHNIAILPYGVLAGGFISKAYLGQGANKVRLDTMSKTKYGMQLKEMGGWKWMQELLQVLDRIAKKHNSSISAVATRWVLDQPNVPAAIIGARNAFHIRDLKTVFKLELDDEDAIDLDAVYEGAAEIPCNDVFMWERGGNW